MNLIKKRPVLSILIILLVIILYFYLFLSPILKETGLIMRELSSLQEMLTAKNEKTLELEKLNNDMIEMESLLDEKIEKLPENLDSHDLIHLLSQANAYKLNRRSLIFLEPVLQKDYQSLPMRFSFTTDYMGLMSFLADIDLLQNKPIITNMQISFRKLEGNHFSPVEDKSKTNYELDIEMTLNFHMRGQAE
ncbi:MAG: type 4a pilus biogenesis protein PilO [Clostridia bacterium]|nr:type 4a pilus biogenesis protein PilO [Clostridia bacterium]